MPDPQLDARWAVGQRQSKAGWARAQNPIYLPPALLLDGLSSHKKTLGGPFMELLEPK
jgi:hypothetical protein